MVPFTVDVNTPGISSTIAGELNFQVAIDSPLCDTIFPSGDDVPLTGSVAVAGQAPYSYSWVLESSDTVILNLDIGTGLSSLLATPKVSSSLCK